MAHKIVYRPQGLESLRSLAEQTCRNAALYQDGTPPLALAMDLPAGEGHTTALQYLAELYQAHHILRCPGNRAAWSKFRLDGTLPQLQETLAQLHAFYVQGQGVAGLSGLDGLAVHLQKSVWSDTFWTEILSADRICQLVFFFSAAPSSAELALQDALAQRLRGLQVLHAMPYTVPELLQITLHLLKDYGVFLPDPDGSLPLLRILLQRFAVTDLRSAHCLCLQLLPYTDCTAGMPILTTERLSRILLRELPAPPAE